MIFAIKYEEKNKSKEKSQNNRKEGVLNIYFKSSKEANITANLLTKEHKEEGIIFYVFRVSKNLEKFLPAQDIVSTYDEFCLLYESKNKNEKQDVENVR